MQLEDRQIRAVYDDHTITVYQAYNQAVAESAVRHQTFVSPPFKMDRMTWIKPSFLWMMYRSGWASKPDQEHILAIKITRAGFDWAIQNACLSHFDPQVHHSPQAWNEQLQNAPVRIQWDPERDLQMNKLAYRSLQIGLAEQAVQKYVHEWIVAIEDVTLFVGHLKELLAQKQVQTAGQALPLERLYRPEAWPH